jgi:hypothetical protein
MELGSGSHSERKGFFQFQARVLKSPLRYMPEDYVSILAAAHGIRPDALQRCLYLLKVDPSMTTGKKPLAHL